MNRPIDNAGCAAPLKQIALISTGGTIEKTYNPLHGVLSNDVSVLDVMLNRLILRGIKTVRVPLMNKDSLDMSAIDHTLIAKTAMAMAEGHDGVIIVHGTDRLEVTGERIHELAEGLTTPIVLTGAIKPYELRTTDALQNLTEALFAIQLLPPGVHLVMHNQALTFPGVVKDMERGRFCYG